MASSDGRKTDAMSPTGRTGGSKAHVADGVELSVGDAQEPIGARAILALLLVEGGKDILDHILPELTLEDRGVAGDEPVLVSQTQRIAQAVYLILTLVQSGLHAAVVAHPAALLGEVAVERIGVRVVLDVLELTQDDTLNHLLDILVLFGKLEIGPYLGCRVAAPHGVDVAGIDKGVGVAVGVFLVVHGGVEGVGETVLKHPGEIGRVLQTLLHVLDALLDDLGTEEAFLDSRALGHVGRGDGYGVDILLSELFLVYRSLGLGRGRGSKGEQSCDCHLCDIADVHR